MEWVGEENSVRTDQIGVSALNSASSFWGDVLGERPESGRASATGDVGEDSVDAKGKGSRGLASAA